MGRTSTISETELLIEEVRTSASPKIGVFGGTFNPIHFGHLLVAEQVLEQLQLDQILFLPTAIPPHVGGKETLSAEHRVQMLQLATADNDAFDVELLEVERGGKNYTIETLEELTSLYPGAEFYFIMGADMVSDLPTWHRAQELAERFSLVAVRRPGYSLSSEYPLMVIDTLQVDISSSDIRERVKAGRSVRYLTPAAVRDYLLKEGLYHDEED